MASWKTVWWKWVSSDSFLSTLMRWSMSQVCLIESKSRFTFVLVLFVRCLVFAQQPLVLNCSFLARWWLNRELLHSTLFEACWSVARLVYYLKPNARCLVNRYSFLRPDLAFPRSLHAVVLVVLVTNFWVLLTLNRPAAAFCSLW